MKPGSSLGPYRIVSRLGSGGMGDVYLADDPRLERKVALKVLVDDTAAGRHDPDALLREARMSSALRHAHICAIYDVGIDSEPPYIAMEFVEGEPLNRILAGGPVPLESVVRFGAEIADGLAHAHGKGIIHRDLKAANVMVDADGSCKVLDFGLARRDTDGAPMDETAEVTHAGADELAGTLAYMAPELLRGGEADARCDIWALGVILYELASGERPFTGATPFELTSAILNGLPEPLPERVPGGLARTINRCLAGPAERRYASAAEVRAALEALLPAAGAAAAPAASRGVDAAALESAPKTHAEDKGTPTPGRTAAPPPPSGDAERRRVTMALCTCEVVTTEGGGIVDPEDHAETIGSFYAVCAEAVDRYGGMLLPSAGHRVTVCFGYPQAFEDAAQRALHAGLRILEETRAFNTRLDGITVRPSVAVDTGLVLAGGEDPYRIVGDVSDAVMRLSATQAPESLVITEATHRSIRGFFDTREVGPPTISGWQRGPVFEVRGATGARTRLETSEEAHLTPLIGRDQEVGLLLDQWRRVCEGMSQVVHLVGEAGIGKSRLVSLMQHRAGDEGTVVQWSCSPYHRTSSLYPAIDFLARRLEFESEGPAASRGDRLEAHLEELELDPTQTMPLLSALLSLPTDDRFPMAEMTPRKQRDQTLETLIDWLYAHARRSPLLLIVEDLHWIDPSTLELLDVLITEGPAEAMMLLMTFRPDFTPQWTRAGRQTHIALTRLMPSQIVRMVRERTGRDRLPPGVAEWIVDRTDGVPLFVEEVTNLVVESGALDELSDTSMSTGAIPLHAIPDSLQDLMMARLTRMGGSREVMQLAATLGREFSFELILAATDLDADVLEAELDKLVAAELLYRKGRSGDRRYVFKHALIQDAAYDSVLKSRRREMHAAIAEAMLRQFPNVEQAEPELLAQHCTLAAMHERAIGYWRAAGERAAARSALEEAISHFNRGLELVAQQPDDDELDGLELSFQIPLAVATLYARGYASPDFGTVQERARELCERISHPALYYVIWGIHAWRLVRAEYDVAEELGKELMDLAESTPESGLLIEAFHNRATPALYQGDFDACTRYSEQGSALYDAETSAAHAQHTGQNSGVTNLCYAALGLWYEGRPDDALARMDEAVALAEELEQPFSIAYAHHHAGWLYFNCRMAEEAESAGRAAIRIAEEQGLGLWDATGMLYAAGGLLLAGDNASAFELADKGLAGYRATGASLGTSLYECFMAEALAGLGRHEDALERTRIARDFVAARNERFHASEVHRLEGEIKRRAGADDTEVEACLQRALDVAEELGSPPLIERAAASMNG